MGMPASTVETTAVEAAVGATLGPAPNGEPRTPEGVPEDVLEESEVALKSVPEVVREEALAEGARPPSARWWFLPHPVVHEHYFCWHPAWPPS
jgi:hypothetical protein